jgi:hypothetical protein
MPLNNFSSIAPAGVGDGLVVRAAVGDGLAANVFAQVKTNVAKMS